MKFRYPIALFFISMIIGSLAEDYLPTEPANLIKCICVIAVAISHIWFPSIAIWKICQKIRQASLNTVRAQMQHQHTNKMQDIEREMDEIEASLDAVTSNDKVTPIWEIPPKKR